MVYHIPAMLNESVDGLNVKADGIYVDVTFGGGGHSMEILKRLKSGKLIAFDQDEDAIRNLPDDNRITLLNQNFRFLKNNLLFNNIDSIDGLIADLGVSSHQFDEPERGFSFRHNTILDMRMNQSGKITAAELLNSSNEKSLSTILYNFGEVSNAGRIAREIVGRRNERPLQTVGELIDVIGKFAPRGHENKFYAKVFQALRIAVNNEIEYLKEMLEQSLMVLKSGGRLVVITYHSLEDRVVKNFMKTGNFKGEEEKDFYGNLITPFKVINKKGTIPGEKEITMNNRVRSARLRIAEKV